MSKTSSSIVEEIKTSVLSQIEGPRFPTPTLDAERSTLLHKIRVEGGFAYVSLVEKAVEGDAAAAEAAQEIAWEQLHSGPWHSVLPVWRDAYAMACLNLAASRYLSGESVEALRVLDLGIIMGGPLLRKDMDSAMEIITKNRWISQKDQKERENTNGDLDQKKQKEDGAPQALQLPDRSLSYKLVEKKSSLSIESFLCDYFLTGSPVIIRDCMNHWPARTKWKDMEYLKRVAGDRTVPVEVGKNYLCSEWKQEMITFSQFLERIKSKDFSTDPTYLAQHPLFDQIHELHNDIYVPDYCFVAGGELQSLNAWFGPAGTVTPLHTDPHHNLFGQVVGRKYIRLYPASITEDLYPYTETMLKNSSQVDLDNFDEEKFPRAIKLDFVDCILEEGEMLYIPPKWWHYVRSLTTSFSVSFWWKDSNSSPE